MDDFHEIQAGLTIGQRLKDVRWRLNLTQAQMAEKLGICRATLIAWERQSEDPDSAYLNALKALVEMGISADWLLTGIPPRRLESRRLEPSKLPEETDHATDTAASDDSDNRSPETAPSRAPSVLACQDSNPSESCTCRGGCSAGAPTIRIVIEIPGGGN